MYPSVIHKTFFGISILACSYPQYHHKNYKNFPKVLNILKHAVSHAINGGVMVIGDRDRGLSQGSVLVNCRPYWLGYWHFLISSVLDVLQLLVIVLFPT